MPTKARRAKGSTVNGATLGFEAKLWKTADALRNTLLPRLISGRLRLPDVERGVGKAEA